MRDKIKLVIAGNYRQYQEWYEYNKRLKGCENCSYVSSIEKLYGYRGDDATIILVGEYWENPAYKSNRFLNLIESNNLIVVIPGKE